MSLLVLVFMPCSSTEPTADLNEYGNVVPENMELPDCHLYETVDVIKNKVENGEEFSFSQCGAYGIPNKLFKTGRNPEM